jgi:hypothetical protein
LKAVEPCPDRGDTMVAHCCDGLTACNNPVEEALAADAVAEERMNVSPRNTPRKRGDETLH